MHNLLQAVEWSNQKSVGPVLQIYGLAPSPQEAEIYSAMWKYY